MQSQLDELSNTQSENERLQRELQQLTDDQSDEAERAKVEQAEADELLKIAEAENDTLKDELEELRLEADNARSALEEQLTREQQEAQSLQQQVQDLTVELDSNRTEAAEKQADIEEQLQLEQTETRDLQGRLDKLTAELAARAEEQADLAQESAAETVAVDDVAEQAETPEADDADQNLCSDNTDRLPILDEEQIADDLQQIKGVGKKLEERLNSLGITNFRDLLEMTDEDYERAREVMPDLKSRMERDNWHDQARQLHEEKYSEAL